MTIFTKLPYTYRDASNYKVQSAIYLNGKMHNAGISTIEHKMEGRDGFIPFDLRLNIAELQDRLTSFPSEDDHVYHELDFDEIEFLENLPEGEVGIPLSEFFLAFDRIKDSNAWNVEAAEIRLGVGSQFQSREENNEV